MGDELSERLRRESNHIGLEAAGGSRPDVIATAMTDAADEIDRLRQQIPGREAWRPIESAPEGKELLLYEDDFYFVGCFVNECDYMNPITGRPAKRFTKQEGGYCNPTHWMPRPEPPADQKERTR